MPHPLHKIHVVYIEATLYEKCTFITHTMRLFFSQSTWEYPGSKVCSVLTELALVTSRNGLEVYKFLIQLLSPTVCNHCA